MKLYRALSSQGETRSSSISLSELLTQLGGLNGLRPQMPPTLLGSKQEEIPPSFQGYVEHVYRENGIVFACMLVRMMLFSEARFQFRRLKNGRPGELFGTDALSILEKPWHGATTGDLLSRCIQDADLAGNFFGTVRGKGKNKRIVRMRPEWVTMILGSYSEPKREIGAWDLDTEVIGYVYQPGGKAGGEDPQFLERDEVVHFAPIPDPLASFRGMSWLTPVIREIMGDKAATTHKLSYFENGAPQPLDAGVLTPDGWSTMGEMEIGAEVIGRDGRAHEVLAVYPQGERDIYRVTFSDGAVTECTEDHIWQVSNTHDRRLSRHQTLTLREIVAKGVRYKSGPLKWSVPFVDPVEFAADEDLPVDPYLLGALLGDGSTRGKGVSFVAAAADADEAEALVAPLLPPNIEISRRSCIGCDEFYFRRSLGSPRSNALKTAVREAGIDDLLGPEKTIPEAYMRASIGDRVSLLQGLIDTDGHIEKNRNTDVRFTSASPTLAQQVAELVGGLGGRTRVSAVSGRSTWTVFISRLPDWIVPCRLSRKAERYMPLQRGGRRRFIESVEYVGRKQAQCIAVSSPEHLYVTDDFILTHNSPNLVVSFDKDMNPDELKKWLDAFEENHQGAANAYRTLILASGASADKIGSDMKEVDFKKVQAAGENRIAVASGLSGIIVGLSEGMEAATLANYGQARRRDADVTLRPLWRNMAGSFSTIIDVPSGAELWFDERDISFLQEDLKDEAEIQHKEAITIRQYVDAGFTPESAVAAVESGDLNRLVHTGLFSVQLQPPGTANSGANGSGDPSAVPALPSGE